MIEQIETIDNLRAKLLHYKTIYKIDELFYASRYFLIPSTVYNIR